MRVLLSIGCDNYEGLSALYGACNDARAVFEYLVTKGWGGYDKTHSQLLISPTLSEVRQGVADALFVSEPISEFTFFFAGHGGVKDETYFLCLKDSFIEKLSLTALSMTQLFAWLSEARVPQTNIIVDSCQSGGVVHDIGTLLNPSVIGKTGSLALSILASSSANEYAQEVGGRGVCTSSLLECLSGATVVQTTRQTLDLMEIGKVVSQSMCGAGQTPIYWGLNLYGRGQIAKNPRYTGDSPRIPDSIENLTPDGSANAYIGANADKIWELYISVSRGFDAEKFLDVVEPIYSHLAEKVEVAASFIEGLANTFGPRVRECGDPYDESQLYAACAALLIKSIKCENAADIVARDLILRTVESIDETNKEFLGNLLEYKYALLASSSGISDLYFLPIRIIRLLGWIGAAAHSEQALGKSELLSKSVSRGGN